MSSIRRTAVAREKMVDKAQYAVGDAADAAIDAAESVAEKATEVVKDIKRSVT